MSDLSWGARRKTTSMLPSPRGSPTRQSHLPDDGGGIDVGSRQRRLQHRRARHELPQRYRRPLDDASVENGDRVQVLPEKGLQPLADVL